MTHQATTVVDPVCGMTIDADRAIRLEHEGRLYYFCDPACADTFRDEPQRWTPDPPPVLED